MSGHVEQNGTWRSDLRGEVLVNFPERLLILSVELQVGLEAPALEGFGDTTCITSAVGESFLVIVGDPDYEGKLLPFGSRPALRTDLRQE